MTTTETRPELTTTTTTTRTASEQSTTRPYHVGVAFAFKIAIRNKQAS